MKLTYPSMQIRRVVLPYEKLPSFHAAYLMLVLVFAALCNLGFFTILVIAHISLDYLKYRVNFQYEPWEAFRGMMKESLVDVALLLLALSTFVYLNQSLPIIADLEGARVLHVTVVRALALILPKLTILHHSLRVLFHVPSYFQTPYPKLYKPFRLSDYVCIATCFIAAGLLIASPFILHISIDQLKEILLQQMIPWVI